jgi:hypothetical protein
VKPRAARTEPADELTRLRQENALLREQVADLQQKLAQALAEIERLRSGGGGNPAPFAREKRKPAEERKRPGRKPGQGLFSRRPAPDYSQCEVTQEIAGIAEVVCSRCGRDLGPTTYEETSTISLPPLPRPRVKRVLVAVRRCEGCGKVHRGTHPDVKADQFGATAHRVDDSVYALAHWLHYRQGVPVRRVPALLRQMWGLPLTQGAITQDALRRVGETRPWATPPAAEPQELPSALVPARTGARPGPIGACYLELRRAIAREAVANTDDTSWRVGGVSAWLMVFCSVHLVVYQIRSHHRNDEVREMLGDAFSGLLGCDRGSSYGSRNLLEWLQQKCLSHLLRNIKAVLPYLTAGDREHAEALQRLLRQALELWRAYHRGKTEGYEEGKRQVLARADLLLQPESHLNPYLDTLLNGIGREHDRGHVFRFLEHPEIEPTNNQAERDLRPAVIARKVSQCSRNWAGAEAHAAWSSLLATLERWGVGDPVAMLSQCMRTGTLPPLPPPPPPPIAAGSPASC